jgi:Rrf2 family protein
MSYLISTKGRYALRVMVELAVNYDGGYVPLNKIAQRQDISLKYLEAIMPGLIKAGLVKGTHGKGGGYSLSVSPKECTIGAILRATEGSISPVACLDQENRCDRADVCRTLQVWKDLDKLIADYLDSIMLSDLVEGPELVKIE